MKVLVFNCGSSSLRFKVFDNDNYSVCVECAFEALQTMNSYVKYKNHLKGCEYTVPYSGCFEDAIVESFQLLTDKEFGIYKNISDIEAVGHRVVHGGHAFTQPVIINSEVLKEIKELGKLAPIHNLRTAKVIEICLDELEGQKNNVGVFDTAFHSTIPVFNSMYPVPRELYNEKGVRKFGFHGISYQNVMRQLPAILNKDINDINAVICHLGSGSSMCCVKNGKSFDTTMGYSPLDGVMMSSRSGSIDPSIIPEICEYYNCDMQGALKILNEKSGYFGICGETDVKTICENSEKGDDLAMLARMIAERSFKRNLGAMMSQLNEIDVVVITGGMGSTNSEQRELFLSNLGLLGIDIDKDKNKKIFKKVGKISSDKSDVLVMVIPSNEEKEISIQTEKTLTENVN